MKEIDPIWSQTCSSLLHNWGFPGGSVIRNLPANAEEMALIPGSGKSPGEGNGNLPQYSCLGNPMYREACRTTVCGVARVRQDLATKPPSIAYMCQSQVPNSSHPLFPLMPIGLFSTSVSPSLLCE